MFKKTEDKMKKVIRETEFIKKKKQIWELQNIITENRVINNSQ